MAVQPYVTSKEKLIEYIQDELGYPIVRVEVTEKQYNNNINKAIEEFVEVAEGGVQMRFATLTTTAGTFDYALNWDVHAIIQVYNDANAGWIAVFPDKAVADLYGSKVLPSGDLISVEFTRNYLSTLEHLFDTNPRFDFNSVTKKLHLFEDPGNDTFAYAYYQKMDSSSESNIYDNIWIKDFSVALCRLQWGRNLMKYAGTPLPGNVQQNGMEIISEAKEDIERLRSDLDEKYSLPAGFIYG